MSIPLEGYLEQVGHHPRVQAALEAAERAVNGAVAADHSGQLGEALIGWPAVDLGERIACAILDAEGFELDLLGEMVAGITDGGRQPGEPLSDVYARFDERAASEDEA